MLHRVVSLPKFSSAAATAARLRRRGRLRRSAGAARRARRADVLAARGRGLRLLRGRDAGRLRRFVRRWRLNALHRLREERGEVRSALRRGRGRRQKHERVVGDEPALPEAVARREPPAGLSLDLTQILDTLDEDDRALLLLKYAEGYSHEELAAIFEISVSACKMRISRARDKIQAQFEDQGD